MKATQTAAEVVPTFLAFFTFIQILK